MIYLITLILCCDTIASTAEVITSGNIEPNYRCLPKPPHERAGRYPVGFT